MPLEASGFVTGGLPGAFALPAAARRAIGDIYQNGTADNPKNALEITRDAAVEGFKQLATMKALQWLDVPLNKVLGTEAAQGAAAQIQTMVAKLPAQAAAMTALLAAMEPHIPSAKEFWDTMFSLAPWTVTGAFEAPEQRAENIEVSPAEDPDSRAPTEQMVAEPEASTGVGDTPGRSDEIGSEDEEDGDSGSGDVAKEEVQPQSSSRATPAQVFQKLFDIWAQAGVRPAKVLDDVENDPFVREDLLSASTDVPRAYLKLAEPGEKDGGDQGADAEDKTLTIRKGPQDFFRNTKILRLLIHRRTIMMLHATSC